MSFERFIGGRYLRAKQKQAFISLITYLSIAGVAVGVMALIVVIAVMTGFEVDLKTRILGGQANIVLMRYSGPFEDYRPVMQRIADVEQRKSNEMIGAELGYRYAGSPIIWPEAGEESADNLMKYVPTTWPGASTPSPG